MSCTRWPSMFGPIRKKAERRDFVFSVRPVQPGTGPSRLGRVLSPGSIDDGKKERPIFRLGF